MASKEKIMEKTFEEGAKQVFDLVTGLIENRRDELHGLVEGMVNESRNKRLSMRKRQNIQQCNIRLNELELFLKNLQAEIEKL